MASQYIIGIWEYHVNDLDPQLIRDMNDYLPTFLDMETWKKTPQLRTVPVSRSIDTTREILRRWKRANRPPAHAAGSHRSRERFNRQDCGIPPAGEKRRGLEEHRGNELGAAFPL